MQVSICIVSYNCREELERCLASIREHGASVEHEVIVVDNASADGSAEVAQAACPSARVVRNSTNRGFAAGVNQAVGLARGEVILLLNPDAELTRGVLGRLWKFLREHPWVGACGPRLVDEEGRLQRSCRRFPSLWTVACEALGLSQLFPRSRLFGGYELGWWSYDETARVDWLSGAALAFPRRAWDLVGLFDEGFFIYAEELDWLRRLRSKGLECWFVADATVVHREGSSWQGLSLQRALWSHWSLWRYFAKHHGRLDAFFARLLTAVGAAGRALVWSLAALVPSWRPRALERVFVHWQVVKLAFSSAEPARPGSAAPTATSRTLSVAAGSSQSGE